MKMYYLSTIFNKENNLAEKLLKFLDDAALPEQENSTGFFDD